MGLLVRVSLYALHTYQVAYLAAYLLGILLLYHPYYSHLLSQPRLLHLALST